MSPVIEAHTVVGLGIEPSMPPRGSWFTARWDTIVHLSTKSHIEDLHLVNQFTKLAVCSLT